MNEVKFVHIGQRNHYTNTVQTVQKVYGHLNMTHSCNSWTLTVWWLRIWVQDFYFHRKDWDLWLSSCVLIHQLVSCRSWKRTLYFREWGGCGQLLVPKEGREQHTGFDAVIWLEIKRNQCCYLSNSSFFSDSVSSVSLRSLPRWIRVCRCRALCPRSLASCWDGTRHVPAPPVQLHPIRCGGASLRGEEGGGDGDVLCFVQGEWGQTITSQKKARNLVVLLCSRLIFWLESLYNKQSFCNVTRKPLVGITFIPCQPK